MKKILVAICIPAVVWLFPCCGKPFSGASQLLSEYEEEEEVKEAEKKPLSFYQGLLEQFCRQYYSDCFSGRTYKPNSLIADQYSVICGNWEDGNIVSWNMLVKGRHSFDGTFRNHNDSGFSAFVDDLGDDSYKVTFCIRRYDIFGDEMEESEDATRIIHYY